jgi:hypothetical protein
MNELPEVIEIHAAAAWLIGMPPVEPVYEKHGDQGPLGAVYTLKRRDNETSVEHEERNGRFWLMYERLGRAINREEVEFEEEKRVIDDKTLHVYWIKSSSLREWAAKQGRSLGEDKPLSTRERETLLKIIGALAKHGYGLDIHAERIDGFSEILDDCAKCDVQISERTLREKLKAAAELIEKTQ